MDRQLTQEELKQIYQGVYVEETLKQIPYRVERLLPYFKLQKTDAVADFACGTGILAGMIHDRVGQYVGVDWILYLHTPNGRYVLELLKKKRILKQSLGHVAVREAQEYKALLAQVGFAAVDIRYLPHYVRSL
ncbi:MAG: class I SAM-dependent methyltransferase, partial [Chloroflexi bacterium]|nr:class I SAM-dependent methyltransferase [Chloroflexota bacterium]